MEHISYRPSRALSQSEGFSIIEAYFKSGMSSSAFYKQLGMSEKTFYKWRKRYMDINVWLNGKSLGGIETKVGGSRYHTLQRLKDLYLENVKGYPVNVVRKPKNW